MRKRVLLLWAVLFAVASGMSAASLKVNVKKAGTLAGRVGKKKYKTDKLVLSGTLNGDDLRFLREMAGRDVNGQPTSGCLRHIDMKAVSFAQGGGAYVDHGGACFVGGIHTLPKYLFLQCPVTDVDLPERLDTIGCGAFWGTSLQRVVLPERVYVEREAFRMCKDLEEVVFPEYVKAVRTGCFVGCDKLKTLTINHVGFVGGHTFDDIPAVERIEIRGDVEHIDGFTFNNLPRLRQLDFYGAILSTGGAQFIRNIPLLEHVVFHGPIVRTNFGEAMDCSAFKGYVTEDVVWYSWLSDVIPQQPIEDYAHPSDSDIVALRKVLAVVERRHEYGNTAGFSPAEIGMYLYDEACRLSLENRKEEALRFLAGAEYAGYMEYYHMRQDKDLDNLRGEPRFEELMQVARKEGDYMYVLKACAPYRAESGHAPFTYQDAADSVLVRTREYFNLDSIAGTGDDISQMKNIMYWLHDAIAHDGQDGIPEGPRTAIHLYEACHGKRGLNCRGLAIVLNELYLAMGFPSRFLTCQSKRYDTDSDCHVINMVWSASLGKWVWMDPSFAAYVTDENGLLLHPGEVRARLIDGRPLVLNEDANWNHKQKQTKEHYLEEYMAKNLYLMSAHLHSCSRPEGDDANWSAYVGLVPEGFSFKHADTITTDDGYFWQAPEQ